MVLALLEQAVEVEYMERTAQVALVEVQHSQVCRDLEHIHLGDVVDTVVEVDIVVEGIVEDIVVGTVGVDIEAGIVVDIVAREESMIMEYVSYIENVIDKCAKHRGKKIRTTNAEREL